MNSAPNHTTSLITLAQAATRMHLSPSAVYNLARHGEIGYQRLKGGGLHLIGADVERYITQHIPFSQHKQIIQGRYQLLEPIKTGGYGTVYRGLHLGLNKIIAIKKLARLTSQGRTTFQQEAHILAHLHHPGLPQVSDYFVDEDEQVYLIMDYIAGEDLATWVATNGPVTPKQVMAWAIDLLAILDYLHSRPQPVIHRDIKPANIIIQTSHNRPCLIDFGIATQQNEGTIAHSTYFTAPEQYRGENSPQADIYSLGATLYFLISGCPPTDAPARQKGQPLITLRHFKTDLPLALEGIIMKALALKPATRWSSAAAMLHNIKQAIEKVARQQSNRVAE